MNQKIVVLERDSVGRDVEIDRYRDFGEVVVYDNTVTEEEVAERVKDATIIIGNKSPMNERSLKEATKVQMITGFATGYDNIDISYLNSRNIVFSNVQDYATAAVAQHTFALALYVMEHLHHYDHYVKDGAYEAQSRFSNFDVAFHDLEGKTWGIAGMGHIGRKVAQIATAFGCNVITYSTSGKAAKGDYPQVDFETLCRQSDVISLHCPLTDRTRHLINEKAFDLMKESAVLVNVARGPVVDSKALYDALVQGKILGAGLDVLEKEPIRPEDPLHQFKDSSRLVITPHLAWASIEARERCAQQVYENIDGFLKGTPVRQIVG
ncbi:MAG: hydroxyacid dehydrogenase [Lachnospiraceae bacterium]|nr:hydroxyacid dehydrogenase [Lachnospiraceae bacterium]